MISSLLIAALLVSSPDGKIAANFEVKGSTPFADVTYEGRSVGRLTVGPKGLKGGLKVKSSSTNEHRGSWKPIWGFKAEYPESYNEARIVLGHRGDEHAALTVILRVADEGVAVRYLKPMETYSLDEIAAEITGIQPPEGTVAWAIQGTEATYPEKPTLVAELARSEKWRMPLTMRTSDGLYLSMFEAATEKWPRSFLKANGRGGLTSVFVHGTKLGREYEALSPWRAVLIAPTAGGLIERGYFVEALNPPCAVPDAASWVKPGLATCDFGLLQNAALLKDAQVANSAAGIRYLQIDWGWYGTERPWTDAERDFFRTQRPDIANDTDWVTNSYANPFRAAVGYVPYHPTWTRFKDYGRKDVSLDIPALARDLKAQGMGLCLYLQGLVLEAADIEELFALYESWGVAGLKPGFVSYGSQDATEALRKLAATAAKHHLWLDIHDEQIPDGFERTWPNVMITEGGGGEEGGHPFRQDCALPFARCLAGPFDYTPRLFKDGRTAAQFAAMLLVYPGPTAVVRWPADKTVAEAVAAADGVFDFVKALPMNYEDTVVPVGEIAKKVVVARRNGTIWYVAGLCGDKAANAAFTLDFLEDGVEYSLELWQDNAAKVTRRVRKGDALSLEMAAGGGFAGILRRQ